MARCRGASVGGAPARLGLLGSLAATVLVASLSAQRAAAQAVSFSAGEAAADGTLDVFYDSSQGGVAGFQFVVASAATGAPLALAGVSGGAAEVAGFLVEASARPGQVLGISIALAALPATGQGAPQLLTTISLASPPALAAGEAACLLDAQATNEVAQTVEVEATACGDAGAEEPPSTAIEPAPPPAPSLGPSPPADVAATLSLEYDPTALTVTVSYTSPVAMQGVQFVLRDAADGEGVPLDSASGGAAASAQMDAQVGANGNVFIISLAGGELSAASTPTELTTIVLAAGSAAPTAVCVDPAEAEAISADGGVVTLGSAAPCDGSAAAPSPPLSSLSPTLSPTEPSELLAPPSPPQDASLVLTASLMGTSVDVSYSSAIPLSGIEFLLQDGTGSPLAATGASGGAADADGVEVATGDNGNVLIFSLTGTAVNSSASLVPLTSISLASAPASGVACLTSAVGATVDAIEVEAGISVGACDSGSGEAPSPQPSAGSRVSLSTMLSADGTSVFIFYTSDQELAGVEFVLRDGKQTPLRVSGGSGGATEAAGLEVHTGDSKTVVIFSSGTSTLPAAASDTLLTTLVLESAPVDGAVCLGSGQGIAASTFELVDVDVSAAACEGDSSGEAPSTPPVSIGLTLSVALSSDSSALDVSYTSDQELAGVEFVLMDGQAGQMLQLGAAGSGGEAEVAGLDVKIGSNGNVIVISLMGGTLAPASSATLLTTIPLDAPPAASACLMNGHGVTSPSLFQIEANVSAAACEGDSSGEAPSTPPVSIGLTLSVALSSDSSTLDVSYTSDQELAGVEFVLRDGKQTPLRVSGGSGGATEAAGLEVHTGDSKTVVIFSSGTSTLPAAASDTLLTTLVLESAPVDGAVCLGSGQGIAASTFELVDVDVSAAACEGDSSGEAPSTPPVSIGLTLSVALSSDSSALDVSYTSDQELAGVEFVLMDGQAGQMLQLGAAGSGGEAEVAGLDVKIGSNGNVIVISLMGGTLAPASSATLLTTIPLDAPPAASACLMNGHGVTSPSLFQIEANVSASACEEAGGGLPSPPSSSGVALFADLAGSQVRLSYTSERPLTGMELVLLDGAGNPVSTSGGSGGLAEELGFTVAGGASPPSGKVAVFSLSGATLPAAGSWTSLTLVDITPPATGVACIESAVAILDDVPALVDVDVSISACNVGASPPAPPGTTPPSPPAPPGSALAEVRVSVAGVSSDGVVTVSAASTQTFLGFEFSLRGPDGHPVALIDTGSDPTGAASNAGFSINLGATKVTAVDLSGQGMGPLVEGTPLVVLHTGLADARATEVCVQSAIFTTVDVRDMSVETDCDAGEGPPPATDVTLVVRDVSAAGSVSILYSAMAPASVFDLHLVDASGSPVIASGALGGEAAAHGFAVTIDPSSGNIHGEPTDASEALPATATPKILTQLAFDDPPPAGTGFCTDNVSFVANDGSRLSVQAPCFNSSNETEGGGDSGNDSGDSSNDSGDSGNDSGGGGGLSAGAIFGIVVGSTVGAVLLLALVLFLWNRRSTGRRPTAINGSTASGFTNGGGAESNGAGASSPPVNRPSIGGQNKFVELT